MNELQDLYTQAYQLHQSGRIHEAISIYVKILPLQQDNAQFLSLLGTAYLQIGQTEQGVEQLRRSLHVDPENAAAHFNLGVVLNNLKHLDEALASFEQALAIKPDYAEAHYNRGNVLAALKRPDEALASFDKALTIKPDYAEAYYNRGNVLAIMERLDEALISFDQFLSLIPNRAEAYYNRGNTLRDLRRLDEALASYDHAITIKSDYAEAHYNRGNVLATLKRQDEALASFEQALTIKPDYAEAHYNRGNVFATLKRQDEALASFERALTIKPDYAEAYNNRGLALYELKRLDEALNSYDYALSINPDFADPYNNRGNTLKDLKRLNEALASYDRALDIKPDFAEVYNNRAAVLRDLKRLDEALASLDQALAIRPDYAEAYWNKSLLLILIGKFLEGWALYEWRLNMDSLRSDYYTFSQPSWRGQIDIQGKRLLIQSEQGLGDVIQFCRYLPRVKTLGAEIIFQVPESLLSLVSTMQCPITVIAKGHHLPEFDAYCPVMSLPYVFKTTVETIPAQIPYLFSDKNTVQQWQQRLGTRNRLRVGLVWSGSAAHKNDMNRSIRLEELLPLTDVSVDWHSLQKEYRQHDLAVLNQYPAIQQHQDDLKDFADTAALIDCLDLVVSVDTSVAHLAGALGKRVWILLPHSPDYRWMLDREDSPWYPTATLYRQPEDGDWEGIIVRMALALEALIKTES